MTDLSQTVFYLLTAVLLAILSICIAQAGSRRREHLKHSNTVNITIVGLAANAIILLILAISVISVVISR